VLRVQPEERVGGVIVGPASTTMTIWEGNLMWAKGDNCSAIAHALQLYLLISMDKFIGVQIGNVPRRFSALRNFLLASSALIKWLESSSSFPATRSPFLPRVDDRVGRPVSSSLESPFFGVDFNFVISGFIAGDLHLPATTGIHPQFRRYLERCPIISTLASVDKGEAKTYDIW